MSTSKTFTALSTLPGVAIGKCSEILENRLQCWKAADYQITCADGTTYPKCRRHAQAEFQADIAAGTAPADVVDTQVAGSHETTILPALKTDAQTAAPTATK
jgi:hypothetical protein